MKTKLTDTVVRSLTPPASGQRVVWDSTLSRFGLRLSAGGSRAWVVKYKVRGRSRWLTLGTYPLVPLSDARAKAREALASVVQGADPVGQRRAEREAPTFEELASEYVERHAKPKKRSWKADERMLEKYVPAAWRAMPAQSITRRQVRDVLDTIAARAPIQANRVLALLRKVWNFGIKRDLVETNPCAMLDRPAPENQRDRVLTVEELAAMWKAFGEEESQTAALFKLYLLTAQRGGELRTMRWEDLDLDTAWWTIPGERAKNKLAHRVPLSPRAVALLRDLRHHADGSPWVFPSCSKSGHHEILHKATERLRERTGVDFVPHDLRRTVATFLTSELGVSRLVVSKLLNHVETGVTRVYDRASYDREKQAALNAWGARLETIASGEATTAKVIPLRA
jgi:integrase